MAKLVMLASTLFVALLFVYIVHQAATAPPGGDPQVEVTAATATPEGDVRVEVAVGNHAERGLREVTVEVACEQPPPQLTLTNIPAEGERRGVVMCPPGAGDLSASLSSYVWT